MSFDVVRDGMSEADHLEYCKLLDAKLCAIARRRCELDVEEAEALREAEAMKLWRVFGHASLLEYMERALGYQPHTARERLRVARCLEQLPRLADALSAGRVCHSVVREVAGIANADTSPAIGPTTPPTPTSAPIASSSCSAPRPTPRSARAGSCSSASSAAASTTTS
jgi:hypothetical protein